MVTVSEVVVLAIVIPAVAKLSVDDSHLITLPVFPVKVKTVLFVPVHTAALLTVPPVLAGFTVIVATELFAVVQAPL